MFYYKSLEKIIKAGCVFMEGVFGTKMLGFGDERGLWIRGFDVVCIILYN
ncbi:hypothetical protein HQ544_01170 [Candidatus Falkowbacteria bacterium]|nr:hypothetical protein [Candidatus Falkowbacteria bacterium]